MNFNWFKCPEGSIHAWEYDGKLFKSEEEKNKYQEAEERARIKREFISVAKTHLHKLLVRGGYHMSESEQLALCLATFLYNTPGVIDFLRDENK